MPGFDGSVQPLGAGHVLAGRYRLVAPIARGGMAEVWEAHDEVLSRPVAVKILQAHLAADGLFLERFRREAVTAARLAHPGIVATFDTGYDRDTAFIVMELVRGRNLRQWLDTYGRMEPWLAVAVARQVADALAYSHQAGLVHRDIKPANILLIEDEWGGMRVKVTDFGIAKAGVDGSGGQDLTKAGMVLGTPKYLSPEQLRGGDPDPRADLYSLGVVLYETLVGVPPYQGDTDMATALAHLGDKIPKPSARVRGLPSGLDRIVVDLLAKRPAERVPTALELRRRLDALGPLAPPTAAGAVESGPGGNRGGGPRHSRRRRPAGEQTPATGWGTAVLAPAPAASAAGPAGRVSGAGGGRVAAEDTAALSPVTAGYPPGSGAAGFPPGSGAAGPPPGAPNGTPFTGSTVAVSPAAADDGTDPYATGLGRRPVHRTGRYAGVVVLALVVIGGLVAGGLLLTSSSNGRSPSGQGAPGASGGPVPISAVSVYMDNDRSPDNPAMAANTHDGNPNTVWSTDQYRSPTFGNLYDGIGLQISLSHAAALRSLVVTSPTVGWSASVYVSSSPVSSGHPISAWGTAVTSQSAINGNATFDLGGHQGAYVLLWITNLGPRDMASVAELSVSS